MISECPHCHARLDYEKNGAAYSHCIGVEIRGVYDGVLFWQCPFCDGRWQRWEPGTRLYAAALPYVQGTT